MKSFYRANIDMPVPLIMAYETVKYFLFEIVYLKYW